MDFTITINRREEMKKLLSLLVMLSMLAVSPWAWSYTEATKKLCVNEQICITIPEKAPDFIKFETNVLTTKHFENGNGIQILEAMNKELTVDVIILVVQLDGKVSIVGMQVNYASEGFDKFDEKKTHVTDSYEDVGFTKQGKPTGLLIKVNKFTDSKDFMKFVEGRKI
jgi:hypothetical protein